LIFNFEDDYKYDSIFKGCDSNLELRCSNAKVATNETTTLR